MKAGECVVVNGQRHGWHNRSEVPCTMVSVCIGGRPPTPPDPLTRPA